MAPKKNAFVIFCKEYSQKNSSDGYNMSLKDAVEQAGPLWTKLSEQERQKYKEKAKSGSVVKYTTHGVPIDYIEKAEEEKKQYERRMFENIISTVNSNATARSLQYLDVCIFHVNTFCYSVNENRYYPAELAVAKFNLRDGVWDVYHAICNPGPLPLGYAATVLKRAEETHKLPVPPPSTPNNLEKIFNEMISFVDDRRNRNKPPPLYVPQNNYAEAKEFLSSVSADFGYDPLYLEAYSLTHLFFQMRNAAAGKTVYPSVTLAMIEFERDVYEYASGICCAAHEDLGVPNRCSKSVVTRMAYIICDHCCRDLNIELIPGKHVAYNAKVSSSQPSSDASFTDDDKFRRKKNSTNKSWSETSEPLIFSSVSDDDTSSVCSARFRVNSSSLHFDDDDDDDEEESSVSGVRTRMKALKLKFDDNEAEADMSASSVSTLDFKTCSYEETDERFFEPAKSSQGSSVSALNFLSQKTVGCDYSSDDDSSAGTFHTVVSKSNRNKGRGRGYTGGRRK